MRANTPLRLIAAAALAIGCEGSATLRLAADAGADATLPDAGGDRDGSAPDVDCPAVAPTGSTDCDAPGLWCEYDGGAHARCSTRALCARRAGAGARTLWTTFAPDFACAPNALACPADFGDAADGGCPLPTGACDYAEGRCACVECADADGGRSHHAWTCRGWSDVGAFTDDGGAADVPGACPPERPRLGTACDRAGFVCGYDSCDGVSLGPYLTCANGRWGVGPQTDLCNASRCR